MNEINALQETIEQFRTERNWKQFHNPKDLAISLSLEASEVLEHFQWKNAEEMMRHTSTHRDEIAAELADVFYWLLLLSKDLDIDLVNATNKKMAHNALKYPVDKAKGSHKKYTELAK